MYVCWKEQKWSDIYDALGTGVGLLESVCEASPEAETGAGVDEVAAEAGTDEVRDAVLDLEVDRPGPASRASKSTSSKSSAGSSP